MCDELLGFGRCGESRLREKAGQVDELLVGFDGLSNRCGAVATEFLKLIGGSSGWEFRQQRVWLRSHFAAWIGGSLVAATPALNSLPWTSERVS